MFIEPVPGHRNRTQKWHEVEDGFPPTIRGARLIVKELPTERPVEDFRIRGNKLNIQLDDGRYIVVHSHPEGSWQIWLSVDTDEEQYKAALGMKKRGMPGITSTVTSQGTRRDCILPGCGYSTMSSVDAMKHAHGHYGTKVASAPSRVIVQKASDFEAADDSDVQPRVITPPSSPGRESLKNQMTQLTTPKKGKK